MRFTGSSQTIVTHGVCNSASSTGRSTTAVPPTGVTVGASESGTPTIVAKGGANTAPRPRPSVWTVTTALLTDHYELTMLRGARQAGTADRRCVFELFARRLPDGRRYGVVAGVGRALDAIADFRFDAAAIDYLAEHRVVDPDTVDWLAGYRFSGDVWGYPEGEI